MVETLAPPTMRDDRPLRRFERLRQRLELGLHGAAGIGRELVAEPFGRGVRAVRGGEGVVDADVAELGERRDEGRIVLLLALVEAGVLEQQDVAGLHRGDRGLGLPPMQSSAKATGRSITARHRGGDRLERFLRVAALRPAEMREQDDLAALVRDLGDGRRHALDAGRVGDLAVLHRHVEIDAQQHALALHVGLIERAEGSGHWHRRVYRARADSNGHPAALWMPTTRLQMRMLVEDEKAAEPDPFCDRELGTGATSRQISLPIATAVSAMRLEKPHSLSYQDITRTKRAVHDLGLVHVEHRASAGRG